MLRSYVEMNTMNVGYLASPVIYLLSERPNKSILDVVNCGPKRFEWSSAEGFPPCYEISRFPVLLHGLSRQEIG